MGNILIDYAGMNAGQIALWLGIATLCGLAGRMIVRGKKVLGLWGDAVVGLVAVFLVGTLLRAFHFDLTAWLLTVMPASMANVDVWIDIAVSGLVGSILIRAVFKPFGG